MNWISLIINLLPVLGQAVEAVAAATGKTHEEAAKDVIAHLTPGAPNAPALSESAK